MIYILKFIAAFLLPPGLFVCAAGNHTECLFVAAAAKHRPFCFQLKRFFDAAVIFQLYLIGSKAAGTAVGEPLYSAAA